MTAYSAARLSGSSLIQRAVVVLSTKQLCTRQEELILMTRLCSRIGHVLSQPVYLAGSWMQFVIIPL